MNVAHLENDSDGGIYLLDDEVADVIEDRERVRYADKYIYCLAF